MTGDTKLVLESGIILKQQVEALIQDAKDGKCPQFVLATGDLSKNGEATALVDVANSLRYMQNEIRKVAGYENFQVFATPGNHDLYNTSGALYSQIDGSARKSDALSAMQFALVFAGLGYPNANLTGDDGAINICPKIIGTASLQRIIKFPTTRTKSTSTTTTKISKLSHPKPRPQRNLLFTTQSAT